MSLAPSSFTCSQHAESFHIPAYMRKVLEIRLATYSQKAEQIALLLLLAVNASNERKAANLIMLAEVHFIFCDAALPEIKIQHYPR